MATLDRLPDRRRAAVVVLGHRRPGVGRALPTPTMLSMADGGAGDEQDPGRPGR